MTGAYLPAFYGDFIIDDFAFISDNHHIKSLKNIPEFFTDTTSISAAKKWGTIYRPLRTLSFAIDYSIWHLQPFGYHLVNIALHALNSVLVFSLMQLLTRRRTASLFIALIFSLHPVQTEVVAWISSRGDLLYLVFFLSSFIMFHQSIFAKDRSPLLSYCLYGGALLAFIAGLLSKEMMVTLPCIIIIWLFSARVSLDFRQKTTIIIPYIVLLAAYLYLKFSLLGNESEYDFPGGNYWLTVLSMMATVTRYLKLLLWPHPLCFSYFWLPVSETVLDPFVLTGLSLFIALIFLTLYSFIKGHRLISFFLCWFFISLVPVSNLIVPINVLMAERFLYLPSIGLIAAVCLFADTSLKRRKIRFVWIAFLVSVLALMAVLVFQRSILYMDSQSLFQETIKVAPRSKIAAINLARYAIKDHDCLKAEAYINPLLEWFPNYILPWMYMVEIRTEQERFDDAEMFLSKARKLALDSEMIWYHYGILLSRKYQYEHAIQAYKTAVQLFPGYAKAWNALGNAAMELAQNDLASTYFNQALSINPDNPLTLLNRANLALRKKNYALAQHDIERARRISGDTALVLFLEGTLAEKSGHPEKALRLWRNSIAYGMDEPLLYYNLGTTNLYLGKVRQSKRYFGILFKLFPLYSKGINNYAIALYQTGLYKDALILLENYIQVHPDDKNAIANYTLMQQDELKETGPGQFP